MADEPRDDFSDIESIGEEAPAPGAEPLGIAWGFIAFLVGAALLAVFVVQNTDEIMVEFLFWDITMSIGVVIMVIVLLTLTFDQIVSFIYRRSKRRKRAER